MMKKGFTLIELLVVIAIIGTLASVVLASLNTARSKARDIERISTLKELQKSLALYHLDNNGYPSTGSMTTVHSYVGCGLSGVVESNNWIPGLVAGGYISQLPSDSNSVSTACYLYASNGTLYILSAWNAAEGTYTPASNPLYSPAGFREVSLNQGCLYDHPNIRSAGYYNRSFTITNIPDDGDVTCD